LEFLIRFADNLDLQPDRFSEIQATESFQKIYTLFGQSANTGQLLGMLEMLPNDTNMSAEAVQQINAMLSKPEFASILTELGLPTSIDANTSMEAFEETYKKALVDRVLSNPKYTKELEAIGKDEVARIAMFQSSESFRHFAGCEPIRNVELEGDTLTITVEADTFTRLNKATVQEGAVTESGQKESVSVGVGEYQIWRTYEAHRSLSNDGENITLRVEDESGNVIIEDFAEYFASANAPKK